MNISISPVSFKGIKNASYIKFSDNPNTNSDSYYISRTLNMELTNQDESYDLYEYKQILKKHPEFTNKYNPNFINIELSTLSENKSDIVTIAAKINGKPLRVDSGEIIKFVKRLIAKVAESKQLKFDPGIIDSKVLFQGLIYGDFIGDYISGVSGYLDILKNSSFTNDFSDFIESFDEDNPTPKQVSYINETLKSIVLALHSPGYVREGAQELKSMMKAYRTGDYS